MMRRIFVDTAAGDALAYLADHPDERKTMGQNTRLLAGEKFDRNMFADQFVDWLEKSWFFDNSREISDSLANLSDFLTGLF